ncbi:hypothetical protein FACS189449_05920 [Alphaproteobacteria bacterium]|nr:hypothetical protein FACS189449_05920 [Alphaproteobacteria bacterium]
MAPEWKYNTSIEPLGTETISASDKLTLLCDSWHGDKIIIAGFEFINPTAASPYPVADDQVISQTTFNVNDLRDKYAFDALEHPNAKTYNVELGGRTREVKATDGQQEYTYDVSCKKRVVNDIVRHYLIFQRKRGPVVQPSYESQPLQGRRSNFG